MFLCDTCHKGCRCAGAFFPSWGRCEGCNKAGRCADCHNPNHKIPPTPLKDADARD